VRTKATGRSKVSAHVCECGVSAIYLHGVVHSTPVIDNLYATDTFGQDEVRATAIVALDADGRTLYSLDLFP